MRPLTRLVDIDNFCAHYSVEELMVGCNLQWGSEFITISG
jgi:hypothetical protein